MLDSVVKTVAKQRTSRNRGERRSPHVGAARNTGQVFGAAASAKDLDQMIGIGHGGKRDRNTEDNDYRLCATGHVIKAVQQYCAKKADPRTARISKHQRKS